MDQEGKPMAEPPRAFRDWRCECGGKVRWCGTVEDAPPCPDCGKSLSRQGLQEAEAEIARMRDRLLNEGR